MTARLAAEMAPAGGAEITQVVIATSFGVLFTAGLFALCIGHRTGRIGLLAWGARLSDRISPLPGWAGVPATVALVTLLPTLFGLQWDESLHIGAGRDEGPLANPSHYFLLQGIFGGFAAGVIAMAMADDRVPRSGIRLPGAWTVPLGGLLTTLGGSVALIGFPLDDVWHRLFGQDVTLWSPTHVTMIAGMSVAVLGIVVLVIEGLRAGSPAGASPPRGVEGLAFRLARLGLIVMVPASLLLMLSLLQGEFDFGVSQYRLVLHPMTVLAAAAAALVAVRIFFGRGAALAAVLGFLVIRGVIALLVGPVLDNPDHIFPLYLAEAAIVELVALRVGARRPLALGLWAGALIGTVGLAAEWAWSALFPYEWTAALLPEALILGFGMALAGGAIGAWMGSHLMIRGAIRTPALRNAAVAGAVAVTVMIGYALHESDPQPVSGAVTLSEAEGAPGRTVDATVRLDPVTAADDAEWVSEIAWQGGGLVSAPLEEVEQGVYRTTEPLPVYGNWKSALRLHSGDQLLGLPIFLPEDEAIPAEEVPAPASFTRQFVPERTLLQREAKEGVGGLLTIATLIVATLCFAMLGVCAAILHRLAATSPPARDRTVPEPPGSGMGAHAPGSPPSAGRRPRGREQLTV